MLLEDHKHRKTVMILRVEGLQRIAKNFKYFQEALKKSKNDEKEEKLNRKDLIVYNAMVSD